MANKKTNSTNSISSYTWLLLAIFAVVTIFCIKMIFTYQELVEKVDEKSKPVVVVVTPTKTATKTNTKLK